MESRHKHVSKLEAFSLNENHHSCQLWRLLLLSLAQKESGQTSSQALFFSQIYKLMYSYSVLGSMDLRVKMQM